MLEFKGPKLTTKLICQAPMIHFQHYENGVTLRASEVKPKFDRYIKAKEGWTEVPKEFRADKDHEALNYKMWFVDENPRVEDISNYKIFYGNNRKNSDKENKQLVFSNPSLSITCFIHDLQGIIIKHLSNFFLVTNFGTMQSKGFGSFLVSTQSLERLVELYSREFEGDLIHVMDVTSHKGNFEKIYNHIKNFYTLTKSGINGQKKDSPYARSSLFLYMHAKGIDNEKAEVKQKGLIKILAGRRDVTHCNKNPKYVRGLLGVSAGMSFRYPNSSVQKVKITHKTNKIQRSESPIFFKIVKAVKDKEVRQYVFILCKPIPEKLYNQSFVLKGRNNPLFLSTPNQDEFDLPDFLKYAVERYNRNENQNEESISSILFSTDFQKITTYRLKGGNS